MTMRQTAVVLGLLALGAPGWTCAQGLEIDQRKVGCVVAGQYPRFGACFTPASRLARARVYFRLAGAGSDWYYVEMASDAPCHAGVLPRPKKELVGRRIQFYVDAFDRQFASSRTPEGEALVVARESDCATKAMVAPFASGAGVAVFPSVPAGFAAAGAAAGGLGAGATAAIALGGAAVVGGGVALAAGGSEGEPGSPTTTTPPTTQPPATTTTTTTTTTTPSGQFNPVFKVLRGAILEPGDTITGPEPLQLTFDMCASTGPYPLRFGVEVDGVKTTDGCFSKITFTTNGAVESSALRQAASRSFDVRMTIRSQGPNNDPSANRRLTVVVDPAGGGGGCSTDTQGPVVSLTRPTAGSVYPSPQPYPVRFEASASDSTTGNNGVAFVEYKINYPGPDQLILGPFTGGSPWPYSWTEAQVNSYLGSSCAKFLQVQAYAQDTCGNASISTASLVIVNNTGPCTPDVTPSGAPGATVVSELAVPGGAGQVVANGEAAFPRAGRSPLAVRVGAGENRVEATLVEARAAGTWRFDLAAVPGLRAETLRVVAGEVVSLAGDAVTFRLRGRPGERVVFTFRAGD